MASDVTKGVQARRLAVLIDGENVSARIADTLFKKIAPLGEASIRRIYGDAASPLLRPWVEILPRWSLQWQQHFAHTKGKNSADIALVIDAMDLLHSGHVDGFCLVSSDSDFTRLATRIREQGLPVYGFGECKTPKAFVQACTRFIHTENLMPAVAPTQVAAAPTPPAPVKKPAAAAPLIARAIADMDKNRDGWVLVGAIGNRLRDTHPDFNQRTYGHTKLSDLIRATGRFELRAKDGCPMHMQVRVKPAKTQIPSKTPVIDRQLAT